MVRISIKLKTKILKLKIYVTTFDPVYFMHIHLDHLVANKKKWKKPNTWSILFEVIKNFTKVAVWKNARAENSSRQGDVPHIVGFMI